MKLPSIKRAGNPIMPLILDQKHLSPSDTYRTPCNCAIYRDAAVLSTVIDRRVLSAQKGKRFGYNAIIANRMPRWQWTGLSRHTVDLTLSKTAQPNKASSAIVGASFWVLVPTDHK